MVHFFTVFRTSRLLIPGKLQRQFDKLVYKKLEELLSIVSRLASFFSRLRVTLDEALGEVILNRLMEEADREAEGHLDISDLHPFKRINKDDLPESIKNLFEEE